MNELERYPSLHAFGEQLDELADRDSAHARRRLVLRGRFAPAARFGVALGAMAVLLGGAYAAPPTRAAVESLYEGTLARWLTGDEAAAPGQPVSPGDDVPDWLESETARYGEGDPRVLAEANGEQLVALRQGKNITLGVADFSQTSSIDDLRQELAGQRIRLLAPGSFVDNGRHDRRPIFGLTSDRVTRVQLNYADGSAPAAQDHVNGAFGFTIQTNRRPLSLAGYDKSGRLVALKTFIPDARHATTAADLVGDFRYCPAASGCPPWPD